MPIRRPSHASATGELPNQAGAAAPAGPVLTPPALSPRATALRRDHAAKRIGQRRFSGLTAHAAISWLEGTGTPQGGARAARKGRDAPSGPCPGAHCRHRLRAIAPPSALRTLKSRADAPQGHGGLRIGSHQVSKSSSPISGCSVNSCLELTYAAVHHPLQRNVTFFYLVIAVKYRLNCFNKF